MEPAFQTQTIAGPEAGAWNLKPRPGILRGLSGSGASCQSIGAHNQAKTRLGTVEKNWDDDRGQKILTDILFFPFRWGNLKIHLWVFSHTPQNHTCTHTHAHIHTATLFRPRLLLTDCSLHCLKCLEVEWGGVVMCVRAGGSSIHDAMLSPF